MRPERGVGVWWGGGFIGLSVSMFNCVVCDNELGWQHFEAECWSDSQKLFSLLSSPLISSSLLLASTTIRSDLLSTRWKMTWPIRVIWGERGSGNGLGFSCDKSEKHLQACKQWWSWGINEYGRWIRSQPYFLIFLVGYFPEIYPIDMRNIPSDLSG